MTRALPVRWLAPIATVVLVVAGVLLSGRHENRGRPAAPAEPVATSSATSTPAAALTATPVAAPVAGAVGDPRVRVARAYALAATNSSPDTYPGAYRRQLALSTGTLARELAAHPPTRGLLEQLRVDDTSRLAVILDTELERGAAGAGARVTVGLAERRETDGELTQARTRYQLRLRHQDGGWRVTAFTIVPADRP